MKDKRKERGLSILPLGADYGGVFVFVFFLGGRGWSWCKSICNPEMEIRKLEGPRRLLPPLDGEHLAHAQTS